MKMIHNNTPLYVLMTGGSVYSREGRLNFSSNLFESISRLSSNIKRVYILLYISAGVLINFLWNATRLSVMDFRRHRCTSPLCISIVAMSKEKGKLWPSKWYILDSELKSAPEKGILLTIPFHPWTQHTHTHTILREGSWIRFGSASHLGPTVLYSYSVNWRRNKLTRLCHIGRSRLGCVCVKMMMRKVVRGKCVYRTFSTSFSPLENRSRLCGFQPQNLLSLFSQLSLRKMWTIHLCPNTASLSRYAL